MTQSRPVPRIVLDGDARSRGLQHGEALREQIQRVLELYAPMFDLPARTLRARIDAFRTTIATFRPDLLDELAGIATGADVSEAQIIALNARSELLSGDTVAGECTAVWMARHALLGQTWDWRRDLEPLIAVLDIRHGDGHRLLTLSEPGMLAKVGLSSAGIGVCLNFMRAPGALRGVPIHVLLRALLDCRHPDLLNPTLLAAGDNRSGHILIGQAEGDGVGLEFTGQDVRRLEPREGILVHSNHFLAAPIDPGPGGPDSCSRLQQAEALARSGPRDWPHLLRLLDDTSDPDHPISVSWRYMPGWNFGPMGTVCAIAMDLRSGTMAIRRGPQPDTTGWQTFDLHSPQSRVAQDATRSQGVPHSWNAR